MATEEFRHAGYNFPSTSKLQRACLPKCSGYLCAKPRPGSPAGNNRADLIRQNGQKTIQYAVFE